MDETDKEILEKLEEDARRPFTSIAEEIGVTEGTVRNRVEKMKQQGTIERFTVERGSEPEEKAFIMVELGSASDTREARQKFPGGVHVNEVAGELDMIVEVEADSTSRINSIVDSIRQVEEVRRTSTRLVLNQQTT